MTEIINQKFLFLNMLKKVFNDVIQKSDEIQQTVFKSLMKNEYNI